MIREVKNKDGSVSVVTKNQVLTREEIKEREKQREAEEEEEDIRRLKNDGDSPVVMKDKTGEPFAITTGHKPPIEPEPKSKKSSER